MWCSSLWAEGQRARELGRLQGSFGPVSAFTGLLGHMIMHAGICGDPGYGLNSRCPGLECSPALKMTLSQKAQARV